MVMRQLDTTEKDIVQKQINRLLAEMEYYAYIEEYETLMMEKGLKINYEKQLIDHKQKLREAQDQKEVNKKIIETLQNQLVDGVETKTELEET